MKILRLGTRKSALAVAQSQQVAAALMALRPDVRVELAPIESRGDREMGDLAKIGGKGLFTQELEEGLLDGTFDFAVHSLKDLPVTLPDGLVVAAYPERADARDVLISEVSEDLDGLAAGAVLMTGSLRRRSQILIRRPDVVVEPLRGNINTRIRKWRERGHAGVILAAAGLDRLGEDPDFADAPLHPMDPEVMVPAPGQGILALEVKAGSPAGAICATLNDAASARAAAAERAIVAAFGGDCTLPLAAWARSDGNGGMKLTAVLSTPNGEQHVRAETSGTDVDEIAGRCVEEMRSKGADDVLAAIGADG